MYQSGAMALRSPIARHIWVGHFLKLTLAKAGPKVRARVPEYRPDMQFNSKTIFSVLSAALLLASASAPALTLGRLRGSALLGNELDVSVAVQSGADEDRSTLCFDADVSYGDTPVEHSLITVSAQPGPQANSQVVRIRSLARVNEAVVSLTLKAGCGAKAARRYVLLSEVISEAGNVSSSTGLPLLSVPARVAQQVTAAPVASALAATPAAEPAKAKPVTVAKKTAEGARLKLAPLAAVPIAAPPAAKPLNAAAIEELQRRVEAMEKVQAANANAAPSPQNEARAQALQTGIESLRLATAKNQQSLQALGATLQNQPSHDYGRALVLGLGALLLACVAALAYIILRLRNGGLAAAPWWAGGEDRSVSLTAGLATAPAPLVSGNQAKTIPATLAVRQPSGNDDKDRAAARAGVRSQPVDMGRDTIRSTDILDIPAVARPAPLPARESLSPRSAQIQFSPSNHGAIKAINTTEMLDVRQQAEFFMALGQQDDAVRLLESNIRDSVDANPLVFLDLLKIFHTLSRRGDFERYREEFNLQFTGRVLGYANFLTEGNGLEAYEEICQQIIVLWPTEYTIDFIEQCLVRTPEDDPEQGIDLEAFKDLLLLYGVLRRLDQSDESAFMPFSTARSANAATGSPGEGASQGDAPIDSLPVDAEDSAGSVDLDLDLDLDLNVDVDLDLDLDISDNPAGSKNNLIDFDMSDYVKPAPGKDPKP